LILKPLFGLGLGTLARRFAFLERWHSRGRALPD
jgi:hypothetical protein